MYSNKRAKIHLKLQRERERERERERDSDFDKISKPFVLQPPIN